VQKITGYLPKDDGAKKAFKDADLIVIPAGIPRMFRSPSRSGYTGTLSHDVLTE
jgi:malate/lactate dehydrogenase